LLKALSGRQTPDESDHLLHAANCFDICSENRNILLHAQIEEQTEGRITASKRSRDRPGIEIRYDLPLKSLRRATEQTLEAALFIMQLNFYFSIKDVRIFAPGPLSSGPPLRPTLPDKPRLPDKLNSPRLYSDPEDAKRQPGPSSASRRKQALAKREKS